MITKGMIFDMDGLLVNSEPIKYEGYTRGVTKHLEFKIPAGFRAHYIQNCVGQSRQINCEGQMGFLDSPQHLNGKLATKLGELRGQLATEFDSKEISQDTTEHKLLSAMNDKYEGGIENSPLWEIYAYARLLEYGKIKNNIKPIDRNVEFLMRIPRGEKVGLVTRTKEKKQCIY